MEFTRRDWFHRILAAAFALRCPPPSKGAWRVEQLLEDATLPFEKIFQRAYRADAVVTVLGLPIFGRQAVGGAHAAVREASRDGNKFVALEFSGGANPERTHGLHYFGSTREVISETRFDPAQAATFGFVTARSSNSESVEQASQSLLARSSHPASAIVAVEQILESGTLRCSSATLPADNFTWPDHGDLSRMVRSEFVKASLVRRELNCSGDSRTFLAAVRKAMECSGPSSLSYFHNAKPFHLDCDKTPDHHAGAGFFAKKLTADPRAVVRLSGQIHDLSLGHSSTFKLWLDRSSALPIRIEFSPRPYLRLALEFAPALESFARPKEEA